MRKDLHFLRSKRNKVFHRDKKIQNRKVTEEDVRIATAVGLKIFYMMIESKLKDPLSFAQLRNRMWTAINRGQLHRKKPQIRRNNNLK